MNCPKCGSEKIVKYGKNFTKKRGLVQKFKCMSCGHVFFLSEVKG